MSYSVHEKHSAKVRRPSGDLYDLLTATGREAVGSLYYNALCKQLNAAIARGEFTVFYQPQYDYASGAAVGAEALVRWLHPTRGLLLPAVFLPRLENHGLVSKLDAFVWEKVCAALRALIDKDGAAALPISVNVSRLDIAAGGLCEKLCALTEKYGVPRDMLRLEITESAYSDDAEALGAVVQQLSEAGFFIEMDDFGSAYSSLNMLKDIPVNMIKIDMEFLRGGGKSAARGGVILTSVIGMARWLKIPVIAEGVETKSQADFLKSIGCLYMQGFYFARPMDEAAFAELLSSAEHGATDKYRNVDTADAYKFLDATEQTALLFNSFLGGAAIIEKTGQLLEMLRANDRFFEVMCTERTQFEPFENNLWNVISPASRRNLDDMLRRAEESRAEESDVLRCKSLTQGVNIWIEARTRLLAENNGSSLFYLSIENITTQMEINAELIKQKNEMGRLYDSVPCGIIDLEVDGGRDRMIQCNRSAYTMLGFESEEAYRRTFNDAASNRGFVHPDDLPQAAAAFRSALQTGAPAGAECRLMVQGRGYRWFDIKLNCSVSSKGVHCTQVILMDVTEQREREIVDFITAFAPLFKKAALFDRTSESWRYIIGPGADPELPRPFSEWNKFIREDIKTDVEEKQRAKVLEKVTIEGLCAYDGVKVFEGRWRSEGSKNDAWFRASVFQMDGNRFLFAMRDISTEKQEASDERENASEELCSLLIENTDTITFDYNTVQDRLTVYLPAKKGGRQKRVYNNYSELLQSGGSGISPEDKPAFIEKFKEVSSEPMRGKHTSRVRDAELKGFHWYRAKYVSLPGSSGAVERVIGRLDNFDQYMNERTYLLHEAQTDHTTGLSNKNAGYNAIYEKMRAKPADRVDALVFLDIDNFKQINDSIGHLEADKMLASLGQLVKRVFSKDTIKVRFGGDEFIVYMAGISSIDEVTAPCEELRRRLAAHSNSSVSCSIGVASAEAGMNDLPKLLERADNALYISKSQGKDRISICAE